MPVPDTPITIIATVLGVLMGVLYGFLAWNVSTKTIDTRKHPRSTGFMWVASGGVGLFIADWKKFFSISDAERLIAIGYYMSSFGIVFVLVVLLSTVLIVKSIRRDIANSGNTLKANIPDLVFQYLRHGYDRMAEQLEREREASRISEIEMLAGMLGKRTESYAEAAYKTAQLIIASHGLKIAFDAPKATEMVGDILTIIRSQMTALARDEILADLHVNANYMRCYRFNEAPPQVRSRLKFTFEPEDRYEYILDIERYAEIDGDNESFALPVETRGNAHLSLPGAPLALLNKQARFVNTEDVEYGSELPPVLVEECKEYFSSKNFQSFASIPILIENREVGVINIESSHKHIIDEGEEMLSILSVLSLPYTTLLGLILLEQEANKGP